MCKALGLRGNGLGQLVGVRSAELLLGTGLAMRAALVKTVAFNPPGVDIAVRGPSAC